MTITSNGNLTNIHVHIKPTLQIGMQVSHAYISLWNHQIPLCWQSGQGWFSGLPRFNQRGKNENTHVHASHGSTYSQT